MNAGFFHIFLKIFNFLNSGSSKSNEFRRLSNIIGLALTKRVVFPLTEKKQKEKNITCVTGLIPQGSLPPSKAWMLSRETWLPWYLCCC